MFSFRQHIRYWVGWLVGRRPACPISSRLISVRISAIPHITVIQVYAPISDHEDEEVERVLRAALEGLGDAVVGRGKFWMDNIKEWTSLPTPELLTMASYKKQKQTSKKKKRLEEDLC